MTCEKKTYFCISTSAFIYAIEAVITFMEPYFLVLLKVGIIFQVMVQDLVRAISCIYLVRVMLPRASESLFVEQVSCIYKVLDLVIPADFIHHAPNYNVMIPGD